MVAEQNSVLHQEIHSRILFYASPSAGGHFEKRKLETPKTLVLIRAT